jgi:hypothetical protein
MPNQYSTIASRVTYTGGGGPIFTGTRRAVTWLSLPRLVARRGCEKERVIWMECRRVVAAAIARIGARLNYDISAGLNIWA